MSEKIPIQGKITIEEYTFKSKGVYKKNNAEWKRYTFKHNKRTYTTFIHPASDNWGNIEDWVGQVLFGTVEIEQRPLPDGSGKTYPSRLFAPDESFLQDGCIPDGAQDVCDLEDVNQGEKEPSQQPEKAKGTSSGREPYTGQKNNDLRTFALGSSARIIASMSQALDPTATPIIENVMKAWDKLYEFALTKLSDSPSGITDKEKEKLGGAIDTFKAEIIDQDQPVDESGIKDREKTNKKLDIEVQIQDLEKQLILTDSAKVSFRGACAKTADYCKFLQSMAKGKGIK